MIFKKGSDQTTTSSDLDLRLKLPYFIIKFNQWLIRESIEETKCKIRRKFSPLYFFGLIEVVFNLFILYLSVLVGEALV